MNNIGIIRFLGNQLNSHEIEHVDDESSAENNAANGANIENTDILSSEAPIGSNVEQDNDREIEE